MPEVGREGDQTVEEARSGGGQEGALPVSPSGRRGGRDSGTGAVWQPKLKHEPSTCRRFGGCHRSWRGYVWLPAVRISIISRENTPDSIVLSVSISYIHCVRLVVVGG